jgi:hypothetical protein
VINNIQESIFRLVLAASTVICSQLAALAVDFVAAHHNYQTTPVKLVGYLLDVSNSSIQESMEPFGYRFGDPGVQEFFAFVTDPRRCGRLFVDPSISHAFIANTVFTASINLHPFPHWPVHLRLASPTKKLLLSLREWSTCSGRVWVNVEH